MAGDFTGQVKIVAVDVDNSIDVAQAFDVRAMPTLVLMKGNQEIDRMEGANEAAIRQMIQNAL